VGPRALLPGLLVVALACGRPESRRSAGATSAGAASPAAPDTTRFERFEAGGVPAYSPTRQRGLGVVHFDPGPRLAGRAADTLVAREEPDAAAAPLARLIVDTTGVFAFDGRAGSLARPGALEFGYEEIGFPILEHGTDGWERVYLGDDSAGAALSGWARAQPGLAAVTLWEELLPGQPLFFVVAQDSMRFHGAPEGPEEPFPVRPEEYILWPLETRGDWMRVRAVTPSDYCAEPAAPRQDTLWIRWRDARGPRVWFYTRGC
jgi:hypothetical protein